MCENDSTGFFDLGGLLIQYGFWGFFVLLQIVVGREWTNRDYYTEELKQPSNSLLKPPPWLFGVVWSILYFGQSVSAYIDVTHYRCGLYSVAIWIYVIYAIASTAWTYVFFVRRLLGPAFLLIITCFMLAMATTGAYVYEWVEKGNWISWWCFLPTSIWLIYASILNYSFWSLNSEDIEKKGGGSVGRLNGPNSKKKKKNNETFWDLITQNDQWKK